MQERKNSKRKNTKLIGQIKSLGESMNTRSNTSTPSKPNPRVKKEGPAESLTFMELENLQVGELPETLTKAQVAEFFGVKGPAIEKMIRENRICKPYCIGQRRKLWVKSEFVEWLSSCRAA